PLVDLRRQRVGVRARPAEQAAGRLTGEGGPAQVRRVQAPAAVLGGVLGGTAHQFPGRPAQQPPDVYLPGARPTEEPGEEFSEGVRAVALRTCEPAGHGDPFRRLAGSPLGRAEPGPKDPGARSLLDVPVRTRVPGRVPVTHGAAVSCVSIGRPGPLVRSTPGSRGPARP